MSRSGPSHYEILGVARHASADEIRTAYRRAAREAHPDRHGDASAARMAAINEAWRVLGDATRRRRYDEQLEDGTSARAGAAAGGGAAGGAGGGAGGGGSRVGGASAPMPTGDLSRFPWRFFAVIGVLSIAAVVAASITSEPTPPPPVDNVLRQGDCVSIDETLGVLTEVECLQPNEGKVQIVVNFDNDCPTGTERYREPQGLGWACILRVPS
jgi:hypothetical protein